MRFDTLFFSLDNGWNTVSGVLLRKRNSLSSQGELAEFCKKNSVSLLWHKNISVAIRARFAAVKKSFYLSLKLAVSNFEKWPVKKL